MSIVITGSIVRIRSAGKQYGMHTKCADSLIEALVDAGYSVMSEDMPAVIVGPLFSEFTCAHSGCAE